MKAVSIKNGIMHLAESKAICPFCERKIPFEEIEDKFTKQDKYYIKMTCTCKKLIGITANIIGDYVAFDLWTKNNV